MNSDSSSDDEFYDDFDKMKAKSSKYLRSNVTNMNRIQIKEDDAKLPKPSSSLKTSSSPAKKKRKKNKKCDENLLDDEEFITISDDEDLNLMKEKTSTFDDRPDSNSSSIITIDDEVSTSNSAKPKPPAIEILDVKPSTSSSLVRPPTKVKVQKLNDSFKAHACTVKIRSNNGMDKIFFHDMDEPIKSLIEEYAQRIGSDPKKMFLVDKQLTKCDPTDTLRKLGYKAGTSIDFDAFENVEENAEKTIKIKYQMKDRKPIMAKVVPHLPFARLKEIFCQENNLDPQRIRFIFDSERISDSDTPEALGIENGDCVDVYFG